MKTPIQYILPAAVLMTGFFLSPSASSARPDYSRRTKQECSYCHPAGGWYLNDAGKYFRDHRNLDGYKPPTDQKSTAQNRDKSKPQDK